MYMHKFTIFKETCTILIMSRSAFHVRSYIQDHDGCIYGSTYYGGFPETATRLQRVDLLYNHNDGKYNQCTQYDTSIKSSLTLTLTITEDNICAFAADGYLVINIPLSQPHTDTRTPMNNHPPTKM
jgi:hypothetical protein